MVFLLQANYGGVRGKLPRDDDDDDDVDDDQKSGGSDVEEVDDETRRREVYLKACFILKLNTTRFSYISSVSYFYLLHLFDKIPLCICAA